MTYAVNSSLSAAHKIASEYLAIEKPTVSDAKHAASRITVFINKLVCAASDYAEIGKFYQECGINADAYKEIDHSLNCLAKTKSCRFGKYDKIHAEKMVEFFQIVLAFFAAQQDELANDAQAAADAELDDEAAPSYEVVYTAEKAADVDNVVLFAPADDLQKPTTDEVICKFCKLNPYKITECRYGCQLGRAKSAIIKLPLIQPYYTEPAQAKSVRYGDITPPAILCENCGQNIAVADRDNCAICGSPTEPKTDLVRKRCGGQCVDSKGFKTDVLQQKDNPNQVMNTSDAAGLMDCKKCKDCGHSFVPPTITNPSDLLGDYPADLPPTSPEKPLTQRGYIEKALGYIETLAALHREGCADKGRLGWLISEVCASVHKAKYAETPPVHLSLSVVFMETRKTHTETFYRYKAKSELVQMWAGSKLIPTEFSGIIKVQTVFNADGSPFVEIIEYKHATTLNGQTVEVLELRDTDGSLYEPQRLIDEVLECAKKMFI